MKMKMRKPKLGPLVVPAEYQGRVVATYKAHDHSRWVLATELPAHAGYSVIGIVPPHRPSVSANRLATPATGPTILASWVVSAAIAPSIYTGGGTAYRPQSEVPSTILAAGLKDVAVRWARRFAKAGIPPTTKEIAKWRRRAEHFALQVHKGVMAALPKRKPTHPQSWQSTQTRTTFVCVFNPRAKKHVFQIHSTYCTRLERERARATKGRKVKGRKATIDKGTSWVIEADTAKAARTKQLAELNADGKGYHWTDFEIHECQRPDTGHKGKGGK